MKYGAAMLLGLSLLATLPISAKAQHENQSYLPLSKTETGNRFPVKYVGTIGDRRPGYFESMKDTPPPERLNVGPSGALITTKENEGLRIFGKDKNGKDWSVLLGEDILSYACRFYEADLDHNGIRDAIVVFPTGG